MLLSIAIKFRSGAQLPLLNGQLHGRSLITDAKGHKEGGGGGRR